MPESHVDRIRRRCMTPVERGAAPLPPEFSVRRGVRPVSAATIGEFGRQYSSFTPDECFPLVVGRPVARGTSPMDQQLEALARARHRRIAKLEREGERQALAAAFDAAAALPVVEILAATHNQGSDPFATVKLQPRLDMSPVAYHRRIPPAPLRARPQSGLSFGSVRALTPDVVPPALYNHLALPRSREAIPDATSAPAVGSSSSGSVAGSPSASGSVLQQRIVDLHVHRHQQAHGSPAHSQKDSAGDDEINALLRTRPNSALAPAPAQIYPLRSIVY